MYLNYPNKNDQKAAHVLNIKIKKVDEGIWCGERTSEQSHRKDIVSMKEPNKSDTIGMIRN
jgi:hypothetical protein